MKDTNTESMGRFYSDGAAEFDQPRPRPNTLHREAWVTASRRVIPIQQMKEEHVRNTLALIMRKAREGHYWYVDERGRLSTRPIDYPG